MHVYNTEDNSFKLGDTVYTTSSRVSNEECYPAEVIAIVNPFPYGEHYVLLVRSCVDDYVTVRRDVECFRSEGQYKRLAKLSEKEWAEFKKKVKG